MELTPIQEVNGIFIKRDDLFSKANVNGGKVRTCYQLAKYSKKGLVTAGSRSSPQINIVANIAKDLNIKCVSFCPEGKLGKELDLAIEAGAEIRQVKAGYNSVIIARAREFAKTSGFTEIPFGMECTDAVIQTSTQVENIPKNIKRIVIPVGSGMSFCGIIRGLQYFNIPDVKVLGICVGANPQKRIHKYAPFLRFFNYDLIQSKYDYHKLLNNVYIGDILLDPVYEAKCKEFLQKGDLFWIVGIRQSCFAENIKHS